jgi:hypothetical protein
MMDSAAKQSPNRADRPRARARRVHSAWNGLERGLSGDDGSNPADSIAIRLDARNAA